MTGAPSNVCAAWFYKKANKVAGSPGGPGMEEPGTPGAPEVPGKPEEQRRLLDISLCFLLNKMKKKNYSRQGIQHKTKTM